MGIINPYEGRVHDGPQIRLLVCSTCKTIEVLPDYTGPTEMASKFDHVLNSATERHKDGVERREHIGQLFKVPESAWNSPEAQEQIRRQVVERLDPNAETGLGSEAYALRDNFREDAMACWSQHLRTPACSDYKSDSKRLTPDTAQERLEAGVQKYDLDHQAPDTVRYLCEYCPVHSLVQQAKRKKAGLYDK